MRNLVILTGLIFSLAAIGSSAGPVLAQSHSPVVVELFTSQGCSSCPPANANLIKLSARSDVLVLSFAVTYWDRLGWKDTFGKPENTQRQIIYEPALGQFGPYTPQMVVNGQATAVGNDIKQINALISRAKPLDGPSLALNTATVAIGKGIAPIAGADVWSVTYDPNVVEVPIAQGENRGRTLAHTHVVHNLINLGKWTGDALDLRIVPAPSGLHTAILVQASNGGPILAATNN